MSKPEVLYLLLPLLLALALVFFLNLRNEQCGDQQEP